MLATLAAFADDILVMPAPSFPLTDAEEAKAHAFGFAIPISTPGLKLIARPSVKHREAGSPMDFPPANRYDDSDCMVLFDKVLVSWERAFIYRDVNVYNSVVKKTHVLAHSAHQFATKDLAKAEFMRDLAITLAKSTNVDKFLHIQGALALVANIADKGLYYRGCCSSCGRLQTSAETTTSASMSIRPHRASVAGRSEKRDYARRSGGHPGIAFQGGVP